MQKHRLVAIRVFSPIFLSLLLEITGQSICLAQKPILATPPSFMEKAKWNWTNDKWISSDHAYKIARLQIDQAISKGESPKRLVQKYRAAVETSPRAHHASSAFYDPLSCFRWGYAAWKTVTPGSSLLDQGQSLLGVSEGLASAYSPHTYEYTRLRFLVEAWYIPSDHLKNVGLRLVKHSPNDLDVKYQMVRILSQSVTSQNNRLALSYANDFVRLRPQRSSSFASLGQVYQDAWYYFGNKADATKALVAYQHCLDIMPPATDWRNSVVTSVQRIKRGIITAR